MKYKVEKKEKDIVSIVIELSKEEWANAQNEAFEETKSKYEVQGFRKGKAPKKAIENAYGSMVFIDSAIDIVYNENYKDIIQKEKLVPVSSPSLALDKCDENGLKITLTVQNKPEVVLGDYKGVEIKGKKASVSAKEVEEYINRMAQKNVRKIEIKDRPLKEGDIATFDFVGKVDGKEFEGGSAKNYELEIGSHSFIAGFEEQMIGMNIDEEKDLNVKFPEDYFSKELAGKDAVFTVKLHKIMEKELPTIDDKWASMVSEFDTLADYKKDVKKNLLEKKEKEIDTENVNSLIDKIVANAKFEIPECMISDEIDYILEDFSRRLSAQGLKLEDYAKMINKSMADIRNEQKDIAKTNCGIRLVIETIIDKENIQVADADVDKKLEEIANNYGQTLEDIKKNIGEQEIYYIKNEALMDKFIAFLKENNKITQ